MRITAFPIDLGSIACLYGQYWYCEPRYHRCEEFWTLVHRSFISNSRNPRVFQARVAQTLTLALIVGLVFLRLAPTNYLSRNGATIFIMFNQVRDRQCQCWNCEPQKPVQLLVPARTSLLLGLTGCSLWAGKLRHGIGTPDIHDRQGAGYQGLPIRPLQIKLLLLRKNDC